MVHSLILTPDHNYLFIHLLHVLVILHPPLLLPLDMGLLLDPPRVQGLLLLNMDTTARELLWPGMVIQIILLVFPIVLHIPVLPDTLPLLDLVLYQLGTQVLDFKFQPQVLLLFVVLELGHLQRPDLVARVVLFIVVVSPLLPLLALLGKLFLPLDVVLAPHVVVEGVLAMHLNQTKLTTKPLNLGAPLVVGTILVGLHLVPGPDPHVANLAVQLLLDELILAVIVPLAVEHGRNMIQPFGIKEPLLFRPAAGAS